MTINSYLKYIFFNPINYVAFPICVLLFLGAEGINTTYFRLLANYDAESDRTIGSANFDSIDNFWMTLGLLQLGYLFIMFVKYVCLNLLMLKSNESIHL